MPLIIPNKFATRSGSIQLAEIDDNFQLLANEFDRYETSIGVSGTSVTLKGAATLNSTLSVTGAATLNSTLSVTGATTLNGGLSVPGTTTLGTLNITGTVTAPTAAAGTSTTQLATTQFVTTSLTTGLTGLSSKVDKINITGTTVGSNTAVPVITYNNQGQITATSTSALGSLATRNSVNGSYIDNDSVSSTKLTSTGRFAVATGVRNSGQTLGGDSGWNDHMSTTFTCGVACRIFIVVQVSSGYESGAVQGFMRILVDGSKVGYNWCAGKQSTANAAASGSSLWFADVSAGSHTVMIQARNTVGGSTWITPYWSVDGEGANTLGVMYYA